ncbi:MAG: penicillin-binding transpeptidase domain-containing protein [Actinomycetota bacterium]
MAERRGPSLVLLAAGGVIMLALGATAAAFGGPLLFPNETPTTSTATTLAVDASEASMTIRSFAAALGTGDLGGVGFERRTAAAVSDEFDAIVGGLGDVTLTASAGGVAVENDRRVTAPLTLRWTFATDVVWETTTQVMAVETDDGWRIRWTPAVLEPSLVSGDRLRRERLPPTRAEVLGRDGSVLISEVNVVRIGIRPSRVADLPSLVAEIETILPIDAADVTARVQAADPDEFVEIAVLPRAEYEGIRERIFPLPGTVFNEEIRPTAGDPSLARAVLGRSGEVTAEVIEANPGLFVPGDFAGLSGLQALYNPVLTGAPGVRISALRAPVDPGSTTTDTGLTTTSALRDPTLPDVLATIEPVDGRQLVTTIDPAMQAAAEAALDTRPEVSALVAVEVSTGELVAVANGPRNSTVNLAMTGRYPPGSIFKVVSAYAMGRQGLRQTDLVDCPQTVTVDGRTFANAGDNQLGVVPFRIAFALSCNTAFINASAGLGANDLTDAGAEFGLGVESPIGADAFVGSVPVTDTPVDLAATAFGQGQTLVSPMAAAVMAATAADGIYRSPRLITSPNPGPQVVTELSPQAAAELRSLMSAVVTEGAAPAVRQLPGGPVSGKTGTAEFGNEVPPRSHAWFVGYQGNVAFAVFVEGGESGGGVAAPIAADFLRRIAAPPPTTSTTAPGDPATSAPDTTSPDETTTTAAG